MVDSLIYIFESGDIWAIILKVLITALVSGLVGLVCTLIGKLVAKSKTSKLKEHAKIAVEAAEQKFPNEGVKMGPQKMAYVMDYLAITFPKIKSNQYLYNIAEAAVLELNREKEQTAAQKEFEEKYGEVPYINNEQEVEIPLEVPDTEDENLVIAIEEVKPIVNKVEPAQKIDTKKNNTKAGISSF